MVKSRARKTPESVVQGRLMWIPLPLVNDVEQLYNNFYGDGKRPVVTSPLDSRQAIHIARTRLKSRIYKDLPTKEFVESFIQIMYHTDDIKL